MKATLVGAALVCIIGLALTAQSGAEIDPETITGLWLFDEGAGKVAIDSSGSGLDADITKPEWVDGPFGKALEFDGGGAFLEIKTTQSCT